eukprot:6480198-Amphidinium_carterae.1
MPETAAARDNDLHCCAAMLYQLVVTSIRLCHLIAYFTQALMRILFMLVLELSSVQCAAHKPRHRRPHMHTLERTALTTLCSQSNKVPTFGIN